MAERIRVLRFFWCFPELLHKAPRTSRQPIYPCHWNIGVWYMLSRRLSNGCIRKTFSKPSQKDDLGWLALVHSRTSR